MSNAPSPGVEIVRAIFQPVPVITELSGRVSAFEMAEVRARVDSIVQKRLFQEGSKVNAGQKLFETDQGIFLARLSAARAVVDKAKATLSMHVAQYQRYSRLIKDKAVSIQFLDNAKLAVIQARAEVVRALAEEKIAMINLENSEVCAPISGVIGRSEVAPGSYMQAGKATLLAKIQRIDPVYVDLTQSSNELLAIRRNMIQGKLQGAGKGANEVHLKFDDGSTYTSVGHLQFSDVTVSENTGMVNVRAMFPNPNGELLPGMFVRARIAQAINEKAILIPHQAVVFDAKGEATAFLVGQGDKVSQISLQLAGTSGNNWIVVAGLSPDDRVVVSGLQRIRPGQTVKVIEKAGVSAPF